MTQLGLPESQNASPTTQVAFWANGNGFLSCQDLSQRYMAELSTPRLSLGSTALRSD
jgi:hypothetical protein